MIRAIVNGIFDLVIGLVNVILAPIDLVIEQFLPSLNDVLSSISQFFNYLGNIIPWLSSWLHFPSWFVSFVIAYFVFKLTVPLVVHTIKLAVAWYDKLKV